MIEALSFATNAILPIIFIIIIGYIFGKFGKLNLEFYNKLNSLCFHLFLPLNLCFSIYDIQSFDLLSVPTMLISVVSIFIMFICGIFSAKWFIKDQAQKGPIVQASFRSNSAILGIPLANLLAGSEGAQMGAIYSSFGVPIFNTLAVIILTLYCPGRKKDGNPALKLIRDILKNPLIIGVLSGLALLLLRRIEVLIWGSVRFSVQNDLYFIYKSLSDLGKTATPLMLFVLGARLDIRSTSRLLKPLALGLFLRLVLAPLIVLIPTIYLSTKMYVASANFAALICLFATPPAVSSVVMVKEIGGDDQLASQLVAYGTLLSSFTMFIFAFVLRYIGCL